MNEQFLLGLVVAGLIAAAIVARMTSGERQLRALSRLEAKLDALLKHEGIQFEPYADLPQPVIDRPAAGQEDRSDETAYKAATEQDPGGQDTWRRYSVERLLVFNGLSHVCGVAQSVVRSSWLVARRSERHILAGGSTSNEQLDRELRRMSGIDDVGAQTA